MAKKNNAQSKPTTVQDNADPSAMEQAPVKPEAQEAPAPEAKDNANEARTAEAEKTADLQGQAQEALAACVLAYQRGERGYKEGLLESGQRALAFVSLRVRLGATRESAIKAIEGMLDAHASSAVDANLLIRSYIAFRELTLATGLANEAMDKAPYGHFRDGYSALVEGRAPLLGEGDRIYPERMEAASAYFKTALESQLPRESVVSRCRELLREACEERAVAERKAREEADKEAARLKAEKEKKEREQREAERKEEEARQEKEAREREAEEAAQRALDATDEEEKAEAEREAQEAKEAKDKADKAAQEAKDKAEQARREKELAAQKEAEEKDRARKAGARQCEAEAKRDTLKRAQERKEAKERGEEPAKKEPAPVKGLTSLIGSAKDMRPDHFAEQVTRAILASGNAGALVSALFLALSDVSAPVKTFGPEVALAIGAALDALEMAEESEEEELTAAAANKPQAK